jgi:hypothetical protein
MLETVLHRGNMGQQHSRSFSSEERRFLEAVAAQLPPGASDRLRRDLQIAQVRLDGDFLEVDLPGYERPDYEGHRNLPFEGKMRDSEGGAMSVLVNMDQNGRLLAVEFIFWESAGVAPDWATMAVVPEPPMGSSQG